MPIHLFKTKEMKNARFGFFEFEDAEVLTRDELKFTLGGLAPGGGPNCICTYGDGSQVDNDCEDDETITECCGPAATQDSCGPHGVS